MITVTFDVPKFGVITAETLCPTCRQVCHTARLAWRYQHGYQGDVFVVTGARVAQGVPQACLCQR